MVEAISEMTVGQLAGSLALLIAVLSTVVEVSKIKLNPWSWLARKIGRAINGEVLEKVDNMEHKLQDMEDREDERDAKAARSRVLRFGDELIHDQLHSKEHFDDILADITFYEKYCTDHPNFENDKMQMTAQYVKEIYHECMAEHKFL